MRRFLIFGYIALCVVPTTLFSQSVVDTISPEEHLSLQSDFVSRYVWRGVGISQSPAVQPSIDANFGNFSAGTWGSYTFSREAFQEVDVYLGYSLGNVSVTITDYFSPYDSLANNNYFHWKPKLTGHLLEGIVTIDGPEKFPVQLVAGVFFYGNDRNDEGKNLYSTYFELNRTWETNSFSITPFIGASPSTGYYSDNGFQIVNAGVTVSRNIAFGNGFELPVDVSFITNPHKQNVYLVLKVTLK